MPRKALRCNVELDIHAISCPGVYLPHRNDVYLSISLFRQYRRTQLSGPTFPLLYHEKFRFDKLFITAYQPQQVADAMEVDTIRIELIQLSDVRQCGRLLAYYECNARDFLYPYPQYSITYGCADRQILLERTLEFPGIAPKLEFSTKTTLVEVDRNVTDYSSDVGLLSNSYSNLRPRSSRSPRRRRSLSRTRSVSPGLSQRMNYISLDDDEGRPPFVVRKVGSDLIGRLPGTNHPNPHHLRCNSRSGSPSRYKSGYTSALRKVKKPKKALRSRPLEKSPICAVCSLYRKHTGKLYWGHSANYHPTGQTRLGQQSESMTTDLVVREPGADYSSYTDDEYSDGLSEASDPGPCLYHSRSRSASRSRLGSYRRSRSPSPLAIRQARSPSPVIRRRSLKDRFEDDSLNTMIEKKVDEAIRRNRSREHLNRSLSRGSGYQDDDFKRIKDYERDLEIARNRSFVHMNDGEYWTEKAAQYKGKPHREVFNENLQKVYTDMYKTAKKFDDRVY